MLVMSIAFYIALIGALVASWLTYFSFIYCIPFFILYIIGGFLYLQRKILLYKDPPFNAILTAIVWPWIIFWYGRNYLTRR